MLLGISILTAVIPSPLPRFSSKLPELTIFCLLCFGFMGLRLPLGRQPIKIIYTAIEIILILITGSLGGINSRSFPFLYLVLVTRSCLIFDLQGRLVVTTLSFVLFLINLNHRSANFKIPPIAQDRLRFFVFISAVLFGLSLLFVLLLMNAILSERQSREKLAIANEKLRQYALKIEYQATLEERNRIAREIHDSLGHSLTALNLQLETALKLSKTDLTRALAFLETAKELGSKALQDVRHSVSTLRSHPLQGQSLEQAIASLATDFQRTTGVMIECQIQLTHVLPVDISTPIYRIVQESLTNIAKHAKASSVELKLTTTEADLILLIQDNGRGFDVQQNSTGFGLKSMRDRTLAVDGNFQIHSALGDGCQIIVAVPLSREKL
ncbi:integral membrane sensor signal transduction histidine kinase [Richelia sinica FACHB-800]|uniref:histidine kinase n=1 Tax=Richelia sinica FACHB-800 TaxID=1357546 RepID=A0A975Y578_9NOST|nr:integral membrane sensor signal transduction histidine kinase [Richelia sinica FACHB-800]